MFGLDRSIGETTSPLPITILPQLETIFMRFRGSKTLRDKCEIAMTKTFTITTDANGFYHSSQTFQPPGPFGFHVDLFATFTCPTGIGLSGSVSLNASGQSPQTKSFVAQDGNRLSLGSWYVAHGNNILVVQGQTSPLSPNVQISVIAEGDIQL